ncbi:uncharacterized protein LOC134199679 [Bombyx mori]|uniref:uncharacterized protein LOC134199679 n=1 Tax=Bombyx mori TaxID=7091 RepID=UPI002ED5D8B7
MRWTCENWDGGITVGGVKITNLRYADDTTLLAANESEMVALLDRMERISKEMGLSINKSKTKVMVVDRSGKLELTGALDLEIVDNFNYLGSNISNNGSCEREVRRRIGMAKSAMTQLGKIWRDRNISVKTKTKLIWKPEEGTGLIPSTQTTELNPDLFSCPANVESLQSRC